MNDEYLDLVDENDQVVGKELRSVIYSTNKSNYRVVNAFLVNSNGQLWIPRRGPNKRIFPLCLDMSMGGHVESGESYEEALKREVKEELNMDLNVIPYELLGHLTPTQNNVSAFMNVYEIKSDQVPDFNPDDFVEFYWLTPEDFMKKLAAGEKTKEDLPKLIKHFYSS